METLPRSAPQLYPQLLGPSWDGLAEDVRRLHGQGEVVHAVGTFEVRHGRGRLARLLAWMARLPAAAPAVAVRLTVTPSDRGEEWRRTFGGRPLVSFQWRRSDGLLAEGMG